MYSAAYYDGYTFIGHHGVPASLTYSAVSGFPADTSVKHAMQTGSATAILRGGGVTGYVYSAMYYDSRYNVAQVRSTNHVGGTDVTCTLYSYSGKPMSVKTLHTEGGTVTTEIDNTYTYDGADRQNTHTISVDNGSSSATATLSYAYDNLGRVWKITRPFTGNSSKDVVYDYDLHGWLKKITTNHFTEDLLYANGLGTPCYNGNVSTVKWEDMMSSQPRGYKLTYDDAGRLVQGVYGEGSALTSNAGRFSEGVQYDANGNITSIIRYGKNSSGGYSLMDNLTLSYSGNRLTGVTETVTDNSTSGSFEYKKAKGSQYMYDNNGSLMADKSRGIAYITYDANSNPSCIYFTNGNVTKYVYSATGQKLRAVYYTAKPNITRTFGVQPAELTQSQILYSDSIDYFLGGSLLLKNGQTDKYLFDGGYVRSNATTGNFSFFYYNKDHLGNNREVLDHRGAVRQVTSYYPFGAPYADDDAISGTDIQPYKYNGKELDLMHGLNTYDYGARQYYSILGRWDRVDPLCEKYYSTSPYVYCSNNPINAIDSKGDSTCVLNYGSGTNQHLALLIQNEEGKWSYYSFNGTKIFNSTSGRFGGAPHNNLGERSFASPTDFLNSIYNSDGPKEDIKHDNINGYGYTEGYILPTTSKEDGIIKDNFVKAVNEGYNLLTNQCANGVQKALNSVGIKTTTINYNNNTSSGAVFPMSPRYITEVNPYLPSSAFKTIITNIDTIRCIGNRWDYLLCGKQRKQTRGRK